MNKEEEIHNIFYFNTMHNTNNEKEIEPFIEKNSKQIKDTKQCIHNFFYNKINISNEDGLKISKNIVLKMKLGRKIIFNINE